VENSALRARFQTTDRDGDGHIDVSEFGRMLAGLGLGYSDAQVAAAFEAIDANRSGRIDFDEFCRWWTHT
jgi:Ca2+-binding EF-hand superfamily protein